MRKAAGEQSCGQEAMARLGILPSQCVREAGLGTLGISVCPAGFQSCFGLNILSHFLILSFGTGTLPLFHPWILEMELVLIVQVYNCKESA